MITRLAAALAAVVLAGCETTVDSAVKTFYTDDFAPVGKTFVVAPAGGADPGSLEFRSYMDAVKAGLVAKGLVAVAAPTDAEYIVRLAMAVGDAETRFSSEPIYDTVGGQTTIVRGTTTGPAGPERFVGTSVTAPRSVIVGTRTRTSTVYTRELRVDIVEAGAAADEPARRVFEGTVTSTGPARDFAVVSRCLFRAFFDVFPGENAAVTVISLPDASCKPVSAPVRPG